MKSNGKKNIVIVAIVLLLIIIGFGVYNFTKKDNGSDPTPNNEITDTTITSVYLVNLGDGAEHEIAVQGNMVKVKSVNGTLYVNGKKIDGVKADEAQVTQPVIIFTYKGKCHSIISYVIDKNGKSVPFTENTYQLYDFRMLDDKCVAAGSDQCPCNDADDCFERNVAFTYDGSKLAIELYEE